MSTLNDIKDRIAGAFKNMFSEFMESPTGQALRDRFDELPPTTQKIVSFGGLGLLFAVLLFVPWANLDTSMTQMEDFETKKNLIQDLNRLARTKSNTPLLPIPPSASEIQTRISAVLQTAQLSPDQVTQNSESAPEPSSMIPKPIVQRAVTLQLAKLNLRQIVDIGYQLNSITNTHITDMEIRATAADVHYFDVMFRVAALVVPGGESSTDPADASGGDEGDEGTNAPPPSKNAVPSRNKARGK